MDSSYDIAVIGGGFGGLMIVANLARAKKDLKIFWAGAPHALGRGTAYSTSESAHVLNVRADRMGAWADNVGDFFTWLEGRAPGQYLAGHYVPRMVYGAYLDTIRAQAEHNTAITFAPVTASDAQHAGGLWHVTLDNTDNITARHLVLAPGNPAIGDRGWPKNDIYISDFWNWRLGQNTLPPSEDQTIVVVGTGLTAIDAIASCRVDGFTGRITAVSPHGRWPQTHADPVAPYKDSQMLIDGLNAKLTALNYLQAVRAHAERGDWRSIIDSLRPHVVNLWQALPEREKARFMRHLWSVWNIHRHRIAPEIADTLKDVQIVAGRVVKTAEDGTITLRYRGKGTQTELTAFRVINCTGPSYARMIKDNPLIESLVKQKFLKLGPLNLGVATPDTPSLHVIGTPLLGERLETTAVPELRDQAAAVASKILLT